MSCDFHTQMLTQGITDLNVKPKINTLKRQRKTIICNVGLDKKFLYEMPKVCFA